VAAAFVEVVYPDRAGERTTGVEPPAPSPLPEALKDIRRRVRGVIGGGDE
jgi:hypothetical protein